MKSCFNLPLLGRLVPVLLLLPLCVACSTGEAAEQILDSFSAETPVLLDCRAAGSREIEFEFSLPVRVLSLNFTPDLGLESVEEGSLVRVHLAEAGEGGAEMTFDLLVEDERGNTLNVLVPLRARNDRLPPLLITEMRTEYKSPSVEYIEFKTLEAGNLGALRLFIAGNSKDPLIYEFSPMEVEAGEYILLHLRTPAEAGIADETGTDLDLSAGKDAVAGARDLWVPESVERFRKTDMVYFLDQDDRVVDAVMFSENPDPWWNKEYFAEAADFLYKQGAFTAPDGGICGPADAVADTIKTAMTSSIARDESMADSNTAADWFIAPSKKHTPGKPNGPRP
jgi:hypothetical protein